VAGGVVTAKELLQRYAAGEREFAGADLKGAKLAGSKLAGADLRNADLCGAGLCGADLRDADLRNADLRGAYLEGAKLTNTDLRDADLWGAKLAGSKLAGADLRSADLELARLTGADLRGADLTGADLEGADLEGANLWHASLREADIRVQHLRPLLVAADCSWANVGWQTVAKSLDIPDDDLVQFLARTFMPLVTATYLVESLRSIEATELFTMLQSVFLSYGGPDTEVAESIRDSLRSEGVKTWFFPDDALPGRRIRREERSNINRYDRMLLMCSWKSLIRAGVMNEIVLILDKEDANRNADLVIPVVLDDALFEDWWAFEPGRHGEPVRAQLDAEEAARRKELADILKTRVGCDLRGASPGDARWNEGMRKLLLALRKQPNS
jgi:hypothetical protein